MIASRGMRTCSIEGCESPAQRRGWCGRHYQRWYNHGDPEAIFNNRGRPSLERFLDKIEFTVGGCWAWRGTISRKGYGMFWPTAVATPAHRYSYERLIGPIPKGLQIDHLCRNRSCVNPEHLEPVTAKENQLRSPFDPAAKSHCKYGHEYTPENTQVNPRGARVCRACHRAALVRYRARKESRPCASE